MASRIFLLAAAAAMLLPATAQANQFAARWQQPLQLTLPEPTRSVLLESMVDAPQWLADQGIQNAQLIRQGRRTLAQFPMSEDNWAAREGALCDQIGVAACDPGACKSIQFRANTVNAASSEQVKARIIENPPEVDQTAELTEDGDVCRTAMVPWVPPSEGGAVPNLSLDLSLRERDSAPSARDPRRDAPGKRAEISANGREVADARTADLSSADGSGVSGKSAGRGEPGAAEQTADSSSADDLSIEPSNEPTDGPSTDDPTTTEQAAAQAPDPKSLSLEDLYGNSPPSLTAADFQLRIAPDFSGAANLASDQLPADTSNYTLLVGEGCQASQVPLSSLAPARVPNLVVALVNGDPATLGAVHRLSPIKQTQLASSGDTLAVFYSARPVPQVLPLLRMDPNFLMVEPEHIFTTSAAGPAYSDPLAGFNYGPAQTKALALHSVSTGKGETVAVIDTGVALDHPELSGRITHADHTGLGWSADAHGTAVASIIAATANNTHGTYGVAPDASILALKACQPKREGGLEARCWTSSLVAALDAAINEDAQIINMSLAGPPDSILNKYVELALSQKRLVVAGAGNGGDQALPAFPAAIEGVLAVTAIDRLNRPYRQANQGDYIDLAAPGVDIITASPGDAFPASSGTSWAAAHVSGIAALLKPLLPLTAPADIAFLLRSGTVDLGAPGKDPQFGHGLVDACAAAAVATAQAITCGNVEPSLALRSNHHVQ